MKIGIISWCIREKPKGLFKKIRVFENDEFVSAELPYYLKDIEKMHRKKLNRWIGKAEKILSGSVDKIIFVNELRDIPFMIKEVFYRYSPEIIRLVAKYFGIKFPIKLYVKQKIPDDKAFFVAESLIYETKGTGILTDDISGNAVADRLFKEFGEYVTVFPYDYVLKDGICADLDEGFVVVFGKWKLENFSTGKDMYGYSISDIELHGIKYGNYDKIMIKECGCGKNKLTLTEK